MKLVAKTPIKNFLLISFGILMGAIIWGGAFSECTVAQSNTTTTEYTSTASSTSDIKKPRLAPCGADHIVGHRQTSWGESQVVCQDDNGRQYNVRQYQ